MTILEFPPLESAQKSGLLCIGGDLEVDSLLLAYTSGIFPWPPDDETLAWFAPPKRAVIFFEEFHISKSLKRELNKKRFDFRVNSDFSAVIDACAKVKNRKIGEGTWITDEMMAAYTELSRTGYALSFETYLDGKLAGGFYGVSIGKFFAAESMFYHVEDAGKVAFCMGREWLEPRGVKWIDCQVINPHTARFGAREVKREQYMKMLREVLC